MGAYVEILGDHLLFAEDCSDGLKAVAIATVTARHRTTKRDRVMVAVFLSRVASSAIDWKYSVCWGGTTVTIMMWYEFNVSPVTGQIGQQIFV